MTSADKIKSLLAPLEQEANKAINFGFRAANTYTEDSGERFRIAYPPEIVLSLHACILSMAEALEFYAEGQNYIGVTAQTALEQAAEILEEVE